MILIADGGSTKTHWCLVDGADKVYDFYSEGYNPFFVDEEYINTSLTKALPANIRRELIETVYFYGAGVHDNGKSLLLKSAFKQVFCDSEIVVKHDLLAACRALLGTTSGFAAILGTGTNTCIYNGTEIIHHIDSAAYILGDEGSGCAIGKKLLLDYIRGVLPPAIKKDFEDSYNLSEKDVLNRIYTQPLANRFCASFSEFVFKHISDKHLHNLVSSSFDQFFTQLVCLYPYYRNYELNAVGSVAFYFRDILKLSAENHEMKIGKIIKSPINELVNYHINLSVESRITNL